MINIIPETNVRSGISIEYDESNFELIEIENRKIRQRLIFNREECEEIYNHLSVWLGV